MYTYSIILLSGLDVDALFIRTSRTYVFIDLCFIESRPKAAQRGRKRDRERERDREEERYKGSSISYALI